MYTPNRSLTDEVTWIAAKQTVQVADGVIHEAVYHLGRTHLLVEVFNGAAGRALIKRGENTVVRACEQTESEGEDDLKELVRHKGEKGGTREQG